MNDIKEYKVIKIVDEETIVINAGFEDGIKKGNKFEIFSVGEKIVDIDTKKSLGTLDTIKDTVEAVVVYPEMCLCKNLYESALMQPTISMISQLTVRKSKPLNVDPNEMTGGLSNDLTIRVGDKARLNEIDADD